MQSTEQLSIQLKDNNKKQKLNYFLQNNYNTKPNLPSTIPISQLLREYLNDDDFRILYEGLFVLSDESYHTKIEDFYQQWLKVTLSKNDINEFIIFWFDSEPQLDVEYSLFDQIAQENAGLYFTPSLNRLNIDKKASKKVKRTEGQVYSKSIQAKPTSYSKREQFSPLQLLNQFFIFYSKKQLESINSPTFSKYQQYYNSINLSKWMCYARDMGFLKYKKILSTTSLKNIFIQYQNKDKNLTFQLFYQAVDKCLSLIYNGNKLDIENQGYKLIGIKNLECFEQKFQSMNILPPVVTKEKPKRAYLQTRSKINDNESVVSKISIMTRLQSKDRLTSSKALKIRLKKQSTKKLNEISNTLTHNYPINKIHTQQIQSTQKKLNVFNRVTNQQKLIRSNAKLKENSKILQEMMKEEDETDPYLKRYNNKETVQKYHCLMNRIDERVQKICNKY